MCPRTGNTNIANVLEFGVCQCSGGVASDGSFTTSEAANIAGAKLFWVAGELHENLTQLHIAAKRRQRGSLVKVARAKLTVGR